MRRLIVVAATLFMAASVNAADLGGLKDSAFTPTGRISWTGFRIGVHGGYQWANHDITESTKEVIPGSEASCKEGAVMGDDGKCHITVTDKEAVPESCSNGTPRDGQCWKVVTDREPRCEGFGYKPYDGNCYLKSAFGNDGKPYPNATSFPDKYVPAATHEEVDGDATYTEAVAAETHDEISADHYVAAVDAKEIINNALVNLDPAGLFGGVHVGADFQTGKFVVGVFGDANFANNDSVIGSLTVTDKNSYLIAARLGLLFSDRVLGYGLAGYGWQNVNYASGGDSIDHTFGHIVAGAGVEYALSKELSLSGEYQHWFATKDEIYKSTLLTVTDERSDDRFLARFTYRAGIGN